MSVSEPSVIAANEAAKAVLISIWRVGALESELKCLTDKHVRRGNMLLQGHLGATSVVLTGGLEYQQRMWNIMEANEEFLEAMRGRIDEAWAPFGPDRDPAYRFRALLLDSVPSVDAEVELLIMSWFRRLWCRLERDGRLLAQA